MERKKLLLLGAGGMAGHMAFNYLSRTGKYSIMNTVFNGKLTEDSIVLDVTDKRETERMIRKLQPDIILNCIGILIKGSVLHPDNAIYINSYFPHLLERLAGEMDAKLIHISTDCVFSGLKGSYAESDLRDADDIYGKSKGLGEVINEKDLTIRTSIIGPELKSSGEGLFHWFMHQSGTIQGYTNAFWSGVTTLELAKAIDAAIDQNISGLVHLTNGIRISKYDLLLLMAEIWHKWDVSIEPYSGKEVDKSLRKSETFSFPVSTYKQMLEEQYDWMTNYADVYKGIYTG